MPELINKKNEFYIDHIALGVSNTQEGMDYIEQLTGVKPRLPDGQTDNWYLSASLNLGDGTFLEIIGPNPAHNGFHPFKQILKELSEPQLVFWYLGTEKFLEATQIINTNGFKLERHNRISKEFEGKKLDYEIGIIGKGFYSEQPNLIQWHEVPKKHYDDQPACSISEFKVSCRQATKLNKLFDKLGMDFKTSEGNNQMQLILDTPKGSVELKGGGIQLAGISSLVAMVGLFKRHMFE